MHKEQNTADPTLREVFLYKYVAKITYFTFCST